MKKHAAAGLYCLPFDTYSVGPKLSSLETVNDPEAGAVRRGGAVWGGGTAGERWCWVGICVVQAASNWVPASLPGLIELL